MEMILLINLVFSIARSKQENREEYRCAERKRFEHNLPESMIRRYKSFFDIALMINNGGRGIETPGQPYRHRLPETSN
jgi:hypothetical protein